MNIITSSGSIQLPWPEACSKDSIAVSILPGGNVPRHLRRPIDRLPFAYVLIEADPFGRQRSGFVPADFNAASLAWSMRGTTLVALWCAGIPHDRDAFVRTIEGHTCPGGRVVLILARDAKFDDWARFVLDHMPAGAELMVVREHHDGLRITPPTSGSVH